MSKNLAKVAFDKSLNLTKLCLWLSGVNLFHENETLLPKNISFLFFINFVLLYIAVCGEVNCLHAFIEEEKSFEEISVIAPFPLICTLGTVKAASIYVNKNRIIKILKKLRQMHPDNLELDTVKDHKVQKSKKIIGSTKKILFNFVICMCLIFIFNIVLLSVVPLTSMAMDYYKFGRTDLKLPYNVRLFYDPYIWPWWPFEFLHQVGCSLIVCFNLVGSDALFYASCLYLRMHFQILCIHFEKLTETEEKAKRLRELVLKHQELIELVKEIQKIYSTSMLFNIIISSFTICFCGFNITVIKDLGTIFAFFNLLLMNSYQIFIICFFGDMIRDSSTKIGDAIYKSKWYEAEPTFKKSLFIIIMRSRKPCSLSAANFATLNLSTFTKILSRSWSYFALLRTMYR